MPARAGVEVVRLGPGDAATAAATFGLMAEVFGEAAAALSDGYLARLLGDGRFWAVAALVDGRPVGGLTAHALPMTTGERDELFLYDIAVHPGHQRAGVGRRLVGFLRREGARAGIDTVFVPADDEDAHALDFYRALGGRPAAVTIFTWDAG